MRIGIDMRHVVRNSSGGITPLLIETLTRLFATSTDDQFYFFGTIFNQDLFPKKFPNVTSFSLPMPPYWARLDNILHREGIDVLFRSFPAADTLGFPLRKQIAFVTDLQHEEFPEFFTPIVLASRRVNFARLINGCGAVGTISEHACAMIRARYKNNFDDVFIMPRQRD